MQAEEDPNYKAIIHALERGRLVPFLGAGANLCNRPDGAQWQWGQYLPSGGELARYLAETFGTTQSDDLARVTQYIALTGGGMAALYDELRELFDADYPPTLLHKLLAVLPRLLSERGSRAGHQLIVTTNYDDLLERTLYATGKPFDLISYIAEGEHRGKFWHWSFPAKPSEPEREEEWSYWPPEIEPILISIPNAYTALSLSERPVILKIHGAVDRTTSVRDSFVITEDDYIDYLTRTDISGLIPPNLVNKMRRSNFLFLGYGLRDWNLRVILRRIWGDQELKYGSWAIQLSADILEQTFWSKRDVQIINQNLSSYVSRLVTRLGAEAAINDLDVELAKLKSRG